MMRRLRAELIEVGAALARGPTNARHAWTERRGLMLRLTGDSGPVGPVGHVGQGEASPLPGYSPDTLAACRSALARVVSDPPAPLDGARALEPQLLSRLAAIDPALPAARFALETALLDLAGQEEGLPLHALLGAPPSPPPVPLCALLDGSSEAEALFSLARARARGITTVKLKIGRCFEEELAVLAAVRRAAGNDVAIRLDANGVLSVEEAASHLAALAAFAPELVEEPVPGGALFELAARLRAPGFTSGRGAGSDSLRAWLVPLAVDESLQEHGAADRFAPLFRDGTLSVAVLKPMALGGLFACLDLALRIHDLGGSVVVTHLFDGPIALAAAAALALAIPARRDGSRLACGLDRHAASGAYPACPLPFVDGGAIVATTAPGLGLGVPVLP